ncbi:UDP-2,3-diacylglucosamine diphosphatase [Bdellovibrionota bacterium FG-1]
MTLFVVSDLHVFGADDPLYISLLRLLRDRAESGDTVILAGDLFDLFVGNKKIFRERYREFFEAAAIAGGRGVQIHYIEGNHDFNLRAAFASIPGWTTHSKDFDIELAGRRFFFAHGDLVDRQDYGYLALRIFFRIWPTRLLMALVPGAWLDWIGQKSSERSRRTQPRLPAYLPAGRIERLRNLYRSFAAERLLEGYDFVVMGHCHDLDEKRFIVDGREGQYVNVGFPRVHGSFLSWSPGDLDIHREKLP